MVSLDRAQFHPKETLEPRPVSKGARMWSVALENTMFTYFEIDPESRFDLHSHLNEQITMEDTSKKGEIELEKGERTNQGQPE